MNHIATGTALTTTEKGEVVACYTQAELALCSAISQEEVFALLVEGMNGEPHLLHPSREALMASFNEGLGCVLLCFEESGVSVVGFCRLIPLTLHNGEMWYEFGSVYVAAGLRNLGVSTAMYQSFLLRHSEKRILATTTNMSAVAVGRKVGMVILPRRDLPLEVWQASCTCDSKKTLSETRETCSLAYGESSADSLCYFRVTKETHEMFFAKKGESV